MWTLWMFVYMWTLWMFVFLQLLSVLYRIVSKIIISSAFVSIRIVSCGDRIVSSLVHNMYVGYCRLNTWQIIETQKNEWFHSAYSSLEVCAFSFAWPDILTDIKHYRPLIPGGIHIILLTRFESRDTLDLSLYDERLARKHLEPVYNVFGMTRSEIEPTTSGSRGERFTTAGFFFVQKNVWRTTSDAMFYTAININKINNDLHVWRLRINIMFKYSQKKITKCRAQMHASNTSIVRKTSSPFNVVCNVHFRFQWNHKQTELCKYHFNSFSFYY